MHISEDLQRFIEENINLIEQKTKKSWARIYKEIRHEYIGRFTQLMLEIGTDPSEVLGYLPEMYLSFSTIKEYKIPDSVISIGQNALSCCFNLTSVEIPNSITSIGNGAFSDCTSLTSIKIPDSVESIGYDAFYKCQSLTSIVIPAGITSIGWDTFKDCKNLARVTIPNSVTSINDNAFSNCTNLKEINYLGTKEEAVKLGIGDSSNKEWRNNSAISKIICTDGEIII